ncbi:MAG: glycosyltransferase family 2 protein, partial [Acidobacteria bacterium]|nr:glycosyltransferase family 2 protein [Acidobacteriota bacterium]
MRLSVVATLYRSSATLAAFHARASAAVAALTADYEIVLVNDGSPDDSLAVARALLDRDPRVRIVDLSRNFGHHKAMMTGLAHARGDLVFLIDADLEEEPELLESFHDTLQRQEADVVYGVQATRRGGVVERLSGWIFFKVFNWISEVPIPVNVVTVRLMTRRYVDALLSHRERETIIAGLWAITGFAQVPVAVTKGENRGSSYSLGHKIAVLVNSVTSFSDRPLIAIFYLGV